MEHEGEQAHDRHAPSEGTAKRNSRGRGRREPNSARTGGFPPSRVGESEAQSPPAASVRRKVSSAFGLPCGSFVAYQRNVRFVGLLARDSGQASRRVIPLLQVALDANGAARELPEQRSELVDNGFDADTDHVEHGPGVNAVGERGVLERYVDNETRLHVHL
jgi:hypothetical protein